MLLQRGIRPLVSPSNSGFKFASLISQPTSQPYRLRQSTLCKTCYAKQWQARRPLSTAIEYRPHPLESPPPSPRSTNIPDTSIAGASPELNNSRLLRQPNQREPMNRGSQSISLPETEAQKSKPVPDPKPKPEQRKSRLRSRKAAMSLTPSATAQLHDLLNLPDPRYIRVGVKNRGCSGLAYHLEYVDKAAPFDEVVEQDGVKVLIDSKALFSIIGSEMDWVEDKLNQRFVFRNPNIKEQCGCGESFMV